MGLIVIVGYRPKPGKAEALLALVRSRVPRLRAEGLVTDRAPILMTAQDGTLVEVSEWKSPEAVEAAHRNPAVLAMWREFGELCDIAPFGTLPEAGEMFPHFAPVPAV